MEYLALYRKYRPASFDEVVEQNHITISLMNQIKNGQISHAYLFCGTRGTGKTSIARIFAKAINCEHPINGSPCNKCATCKMLSDASNMDIMEIDAASNNKVEEIRELREKVKYPPVNGKYKVYIIDEVHMLTDSAFNALLKTLEEPPSYVVFILGTTEVQKLPATILSRCLRFDFKLISNEALEKHIKRVFDDSKIKYEDEGVSLIARLGEGSVRDALSIADMCVAYTNKNITYKSVIECVGATDREILNTLAQFLLKKESKNMLAQINEIANSGKNIAQLCKDLASYFRDIAVVQTCDNYEDILKYPANITKGLKQLASYNNSQVLNILKTLASLEQDFRYTQNPRALFEIVMLGLVSGNNCEENANVEDKINSQVYPQQTRVEQKENKLENVQKSVKTIKHSGEEILAKMLITLRENKDFKLYVMLENITVSEIENGNLTIITNNEDNYNTLNKNGNIDALDKVLKSIDSSLNMQIKFKKQESKKVDVENILKSDFGKILKINKGE